MNRAPVVFGVPMLRVTSFGLVALVTLVGSAAAETKTSSPTPGKSGRLGYVVVDTTEQDLKAPATLSGQTIFLDRCLGGCTINPGAADDATLDTPVSQIISQPSS